MKYFHSSIYKNQARQIDRLSGLKKKKTFKNRPATLTEHHKNARQNVPTVRNS